MNIVIDNLDHYLICPVCRGYLRFAHTISDCGHTFCYLCIRNQPQCRKCGINIEKGSLKKDPYIQNLVDVILPEYQAKDDEILARIKSIISFDSSILLNLRVEKEYSAFKKSITHTDTQTELGSQVMEKLGISWEEFKHGILDEQTYKSYLKMTSNQPIEQHTEHKINIRPLTDQDMYRCLSKRDIVKLSRLITYQQKHEHEIFIRLRKFVFKNIKDPNIIKDEKGIKLTIHGRELYDDDNVSKLYEVPSNELIIRYQVLYK